jgi:hypothetical protein
VRHVRVLLRRQDQQPGGAVRVDGRAGQVVQGSGAGSTGNRDAGRWCSSTGAASHDLDRIDHVGVVEQVRKDGTLVTLEGNTSDRVARRVRTMSTVVGFGHPEWEKKPVKHERKWRVVATTRFGGVRIIYRLNGGGYSWNPKKGSPRAVLTAHQVTEAKKWAKRHAAKTVRTVPLDGWTHLRLDPSTRWPTDQALLRRLNRVGRRLNRIVYIKSGHRNLSEQWGFWNHYQRYGSPVAAYPNANAPHIRGVAADCGIIDRRGNYSSLGLNRRPGDSLNDSA